MRRHRGVALSLCFLFLFSGAAAGQDYEGLLDKGLKSSEPYAHNLTKKARAASSGERIGLLTEAVRFAPDLPAVYFELSRASFPGLASLDYAIKGIKAYRRNFWWLLSLGGTLYVGLIVSFLTALFAVAAVRLAYEIPLLNHDIAEEKRKLVLPLLLIPVSFLGPVFFAVGALCIAGLYMRSIDKGIVYAGLLFVFFSPFFLHAADLFFSAPASPGVKAMVSVNEGKENGYAIYVLRDGEDFASRFSYALALKREGRIEEAIAVYEGLLKTSDDPRVLNNLANAYAAAGRADSAKEHYKKALETSPSAVLFYNISQVYRDTLDFQAGDEYFNEALKIDRDRVSQFAAISTRNPNRLVIDETLSASDILSAARENRRAIINFYTVGPYAASAASALLFAGFYAIDRRSLLRAYRCSRCGAVVCSRCARAVQRGQMCNLCYSSIVKLVDVDPAERVAKLLEAQERKNKRDRLLKILSFAPPGAAHIYSGKLLSGFLLLWGFSFALVTFFLNPLFHTGMAASSHGWLSPIMALSAVLLYVINLFAVSGLEGEWH